MRQPARPRRAGPDDGGADQQPEGEGCLLRDDAVADDLQLAGAGDAGQPCHESRGKALSSGSLARRALSHSIW
jgi:hypothetical protein